MSDLTLWQVLVTGALGGVGLLGGYTAWMHSQITQERESRARGDEQLWGAVDGLRDDATTLERRLSDKIDALATKEDLLAMENRMMRILHIGEGD
ncbi:MAG: hypothetical protein P4L71_00410 [Acetobacteraceae bacterium]|nr:hypothetical protein [Acetobacteraceae bacterium]